jgi:hypothetical protein
MRRPARRRAATLERLESMLDDFLLGLKNAAQVLQPTREHQKRETFLDHMDIGTDAAI